MASAGGAPGIGFWRTTQEAGLAPGSRMERLPKIVCAPFLGLGLGLGQEWRGAPSTPVPIPGTAQGGATSYVREGDRYFKVMVFADGEALSVEDGSVSLEFLVAGASGDAGAAPGAIRKYVADEPGNTEAGPLSAAAGTYPVAVGAAGGAGIPGGESLVNGIAADGGAA